MVWTEIRCVCFFVHALRALCVRFGVLVDSARRVGMQSADERESMRAFIYVVCGVWACQKPSNRQSYDIMKVKARLSKGAMYYTSVQFWRRLRSWLLLFENEITTTGHPMS